MGCGNIQAVEKKTGINIATLNYSGILNSPFEFYSKENEEEEKKLGQIFNKLLNNRQIFKGKAVKWEVGEIDKKMQIQRYTPIYKKFSGVQNGKLLTEKQFLQKWDQQFDREIKKIVGIKYDDHNRKQIQTFDLVCYETFMNFLFNGVDIKSDSVKKLDGSLYVTFMDKYFSSAFINEELKIQKTLRTLFQHNFSVVFLQQGSKRFKQRILKDYSQRFYLKSLQTCESIILISQRFLKEFELQDNSEYVFSLFNQSQKAKLKWNQDTVFAVFGKNVFISGHLSSKKQKNIIQVSQLKESLEILKNKLKQYRIFIGIDANTANLTLQQPFFCYPKGQYFTTCKKRTFIQLQTNKANQLAMEKRDYIISNQKISHFKRSTIDMKEVDESYYIPSSEHPFDHYLLSCQVFIQQKNSN